MDRATRERIRAEAVANRNKPAASNGVVAAAVKEAEIRSAEKPARCAMTGPVTADTHISPADKPAKPKKEKSAVSKDGIPKITFLCGHPGCLPLCGPCRDKLNQERVARRREKNIAKQAARVASNAHEEFNPKSRLPDKSHKTLMYDAATVSWSGILVVPNIGTFTAQEVSEKRCYHALDDRYREHIGQQPAPANSEKSS